MSMTRGQVSRLLAVLAAADHRPFDEHEPDVWLAVAEERRWSYDEANAAARYLLARRRRGDGYVRPADVHEVIRQRREDEHHRREAEEREARRAGMNLDPVTVEHRRRTVAEFAEALATRNGIGKVDEAMGWDPERRSARRHPCPHCHAGERQPCVRTSRRGTVPLENGAVHPSRLDPQAESSTTLGASPPPLEFGA
jgi:hypothetical protein